MTNTICLLDDAGIEMLVTYDMDKDRCYYAEPGNPSTYVDALVSYTLRSVELVVAGKGIEIMPMLNSKQKEAIIEEINEL